MALLVDGAWCEAEELLAYDGSAASVAAEEGIDLDAKMALSERWITDQVDDFLRWESKGGEGAPWLGGIDAGHAVVNDRLKRWHLTHTLALLYRDASFSQVNDRYQKKWQAYEKDAAQMRVEYFQGGIPYVNKPVRRPGAPTVTLTTGDLAAAAYFIATTQVNTEGTESALSAVTSAQAADGNGLTVMANRVDAGNSWNVYAADSSGTMRRQNDSPLDADAAWTMPDTGVAAGAAATCGQVPDGRVKERRILPRG